MYIICFTLIDIHTLYHVVYKVRKASVLVWCFGCVFFFLLLVLCVCVFFFSLSLVLVSVLLWSNGTIRPLV